jgi:hypothetical protein
VSTIRTARENSWRSIAPEPSRSNTLNAFVTCRKRKNAGTQDRFSGGWIPSCCSLGGVSVNGFVLQLGFVRFASLALETLRVVVVAPTAALSILLPAGCRPVCCMQITDHMTAVLSLSGLKLSTFLVSAITHTQGPSDVTNRVGERTSDAGADFVRHQTVPKLDWAIHGRRLGRDCMQLDEQPCSSATSHTQHAQQKRVRHPSVSFVLSLT